MGFSRSVRAPARTLALCTADHDEGTNGDSDGNGEERVAGSAAGSSSDAGPGRARARAGEGRDAERVRALSAASSGLRGPTALPYTQSPETSRAPETRTPVPLSLRL